MKKFFSLFAALMLVLSVNAAPFAAKKVAKQTVSTRPAVGAVDVRQGLAHRMMKKAAAPAGVAEFVDTYDVPAAKLSDYTQYAGEEWFQMSGDTEDGAYVVSVCVNTNQLEGFFSTADIDFEYTFIGEYATMEALALVSGDVVVTVDNDTVFLEASFADADGAEYNVTMKHFVPGKDNMVTLNMDQADFDDTYAAYGLLYMFAMTNDQQNGIQFGLWSDAADFAGSYTENDLDTYLGDAYLVVNGAELSIVMAEFTVANDGTNITVEGDFLASNNQWYHITFTFAYSGGGGDSGDEYDMEEDVNVAYATTDVETFEVDAAEGFAYVRIIKGNEVFATLIYVSGNTLPAGTYTIDDSYAPGSVQPGELYNGSLYPTFWATVDSEGYINVPLFFCVDGTVEVSYDAAGALVLEVNATNTWGNSLHLTLNAATAVENVEAGLKAVKTVKDGQLVIIKNGVEFNAQGAKL